MNQAQQRTSTTDWHDAKPAEIVAGIRRGDASAEDQLVERFARGVAVVLDRHTHGRPEAQDLFQETFAVALEKLRAGELRDPERLAGFMVAIARNLAIAWYRKRARRKTDDAGDTLAEVVSPRPGADARVAARETAVLVREVIANLGTDRDREILFRFYIAEHDKDEICADLRLTRVQFNRVLHRARDRFRTMLEARGISARMALASFVLAVLVCRWVFVDAMIRTLVSHGK